MLQPNNCGCDAACCRSWPLVPLTVALVPSVAVFCSTSCTICVSSIPLCSCLSCFSPSCACFLGSIKVDRAFFRASCLDHLLAVCWNVAIVQMQPSKLSLLLEDACPIRTLGIGIEPGGIRDQVNVCQRGERRLAEYSANLLTHFRVKARCNKI